MLVLMTGLCLCKICTNEKEKQPEPGLGQMMGDEDEI